MVNNEIAIDKTSFDKIKEKIKEGLVYGTLILKNEETNEKIEFVPMKVNGKFVVFIPDWFEKQHIENIYGEDVSDEEFERLCEETIDITDDVYFLIRNIKNKQKIN